MTDSCDQHFLVSILNFLFLTIKDFCNILNFDENTILLVILEFHKFKFDGL